MRGRFSADQLQTMIGLYKSGVIAEQVAKSVASVNAASNGYSSNTAYVANAAATHDQHLRCGARRLVYGGG
jgi:hypothetical protein